MKTLYVTDLDGTLMRDDKTISNKSVAVLNRLIEKGMFFTYATARSLDSASEITKHISLRLPVIIRNGTILADPVSKKEIEISMFAEELNQIRQALAGTAVPRICNRLFRLGGSKTVPLGKDEQRFSGLSAKSFCGQAYSYD